MTRLRAGLLAVLGLFISDRLPAKPPATGPQTAEIALLFLGNSHTQLHQIPDLVAGLLRQLEPARPVLVTTAPGLLFLDERRSDPETRALFSSRSWTHVVLQAQRYSSSGRTRYPTSDARAWVRRVQARQAMPLLFPEWPRQGMPEEASRIHALYAGIGTAESACVAPVPQGFELAARLNPGLLLHEADGNHSNPAGALLAAYLLFASASGIAPEQLQNLPHLPLSPVDAPTQQELRRLAAATLATAPDLPSPCPRR